MELYNPHCFIGCDKEFEEANCILFGAPFDGTVSYRPGSRFAPMRIRPDSYGLETYSPYQNKDIEDCLIHDAGDLDVPFGDVKRAHEVIENYTDYLLNEGKKPFMIGGEHSVSLPTIRACAKQYSELCVIHFDAHTDLRDHYMGVELSHASVIKHAWSILGDERIYQFGIRSGLREEFDWADEGHTHLCKFDTSTLEQAIETIGDRPVYVTIDLDVLDPSIMSGTGTPEPGGLTFKELLDAVLSLKTLNIIGADVVELAPDYDASGVSTAVASKIIRELIMVMESSRREN